MSSLGIYFGPKIISVVETKGKKVLNNLQLSRLELSAGELEEKVPDEVKLVAFLKEGLRRNKIENKEAGISLSGRDLIVRTFEMPLLPRDELLNAVNFEAKKYIPFKVEELVADFQSEFDKLSRKNLVLFVGIKKETLDKYFSILNQLNIKINTLEYAGFSIIRLLKLSGLSDKGIIGIISMDIQEEDEVNFTVLENGFPLFSRDITLMGAPAELIETPPPEEPKISLEKLRTEIRISLDYYHRKFLTKEIKKIFLISSHDYRGDLELFIKEMGLSVQFIDVARYTGRPDYFSLSFIKGYSSSLTNIKTNLKINLLIAKKKILKEITAEPAAVPLLAGLKIEPHIVILGLLICITVFIFGSYQRLPIKKELNNIINLRPLVSTINPQASYEELSNINSEYNQKINALDNLIKKQLYFTQALNVLPRIIPEGMWLTDLSFRKGIDDAELLLHGIAYSSDVNKEFELVNTFLSNLKTNSIFTKYFKDIAIVSVDQGLFKEKITANFVVSCRTSYRGR